MQKDLFISGLEVCSLEILGSRHFHLLKLLIDKVGWKVT